VRRSRDQRSNSDGTLTKDRATLVQLLNESDRELQETKVARFNELAKAAEFGRLAQGLFHDLMTPLSSVILQTEKLTNTAAEKSYGKALEASKRMAAYIKDIRATLAREEALRLCDLKVELDQVLQFLSYQAREKDVTIKSRIEKVSWFGSPTKIRQIFSNLISNAIDSFDGVNRCKKTARRNKDSKISRIGTHKRHR
jgi:signal transduction histidine kinase